jgi:hypothetical protein
MAGRVFENGERTFTFRAATWIADHMVRPDQVPARPAKDGERDVLDVILSLADHPWKVDEQQ